ncbi:MAG: precorrin-8X methylmutase [Candidatus Accumulibacter sp.]|jgi:precorrin-8X/cobalt-precorrin-8 methylmutase|nr:precorrin-8X methylmutase [Accumulibacter sp.]
MTKITEQMTLAGRAIEVDSFDLIDTEAGSRAKYTDEEWPLVRRMIHASGDFDFNGLTEFHPNAVVSGVAAIRKGGTRIVADVEMICAGLSAPRLEYFGMTALRFIADPDVVERARAQGSTRAVQAMRKAHCEACLDGAIVGIGNAPTALLEVIRLVRAEGAKPSLIIGMPVGFVSAVESKDMLMTLEEVPWISVRGRKGGSTLVVAAIHALLALAQTGREENG